MLLLNADFWYRGRIDGTEVDYRIVAGVLAFLLLIILVLLVMHVTERN